jgi:molybdate transport system regulatory protein
MDGIALDGEIWMTVGGEHLGGPGRIALLAKIAECGSITQAAKAIKMSYKAAWDAIDAMNNLAGEPLVERLAGGRGGGGTRLTARGEQLVASFRLIEREHRDFVKRLGGVADDYLLVRKMSMRTSARNQFSGTVTQIKRGAVNDEVSLEVAGGHAIVAIVTHESVDNLGLQVGSEAFALVKSSSIILVTGDGDGGARYFGPQPPGRHHRPRRAGRREHGSRDRPGGRRHGGRHRHQGQQRGHGPGRRRARRGHLQGVQRHHRRPCLTSTWRVASPCWAAEPCARLAREALQ